MILVPTDYSDNSKPGLRFAIRLASRNKHPLVFVNVLQIKRPYPGDGAQEDNFETQKAEQIAKAKLKLESFVRKIYQSLKVEPAAYTCEIIEGLKADISLVDYCKDRQDIEFIVISTRGASFMNKVLGTNTGNLITKSPVPVIAVPKDYRFKPLRNVLYATDLDNLDSEFQRVLDFAKPRGLSIELLHFSTPSTKDLESCLHRDELEMKAGYPLNIKVIPNNHSHPISRNLQNEIEKIQPSMVILFTKQDRKFFEKLFLSSMAEDLSFKSTIPLLVFNKG